MTLFEMLSGVRLYSGPEVNEVARRILTEPPPDIQSFRDDVPPEVEELLFELLAKQRELRPASAKDVALILEDAASERARGWTRSRRLCGVALRLRPSRVSRPCSASAVALAPQVASPSSDPTPAVMPATSSGPKTDSAKARSLIAAGLVFALALFGFWWG
ncbi:MAG: hypothetical protein R3B07_21105 [Polyangiaceae bacterium]